MLFLPLDWETDWEHHENQMMYQWSPHMDANREHTISWSNNMGNTQMAHDIVHRLQFGWWHFSDSSQETKMDIFWNISHIGPFHNKRILHYIFIVNADIRRIRRKIREKRSNLTEKAKEGGSLPIDGTPISVFELSLYHYICDDPLERCKCGSTH